VAASPRATAWPHFRALGLLHAAATSASRMAPPRHVVCVYRLERASPYSINPLSLPDLCGSAQRRPRTSRTGKVCGGEPLGLSAPLLRLCASSFSGAGLVGWCRARPVPTGCQRMARRQAVDKSRRTRAQQGEDGVLLQRAGTQRAVAMATSAAIATGVGASSHAPVPQERRRCPRTSIPHAGARAAPGSCAAARCAAEAHQ
jgi:hypothetical protein